MNLREAIRRGAERVDRRALGVLVMEYDGSYMACALGAAYLGCHPDVEVGLADVHTINRWVNGITDAASRRHGDGPPLDGEVINVNDHVVGGRSLEDGEGDPGRDWDLLLDTLHEHRMRDGTPLDKVKVCDDPEDCT